MSSRNEIPETQGCQLVLSARAISKSYRQNGAEYPVLHDVAMQVASGQFVAIMGPSGSGKSTLLHILGLLASPTGRGSLTIDGVETIGLSQSQRTVVRRDKIGFVFQRFNLLAVLTAEDNLALALKLRNEPIDHRIDSVLEFVGLGHKRRSKPGQMSIGEQQRLAFARAFVHNPAILLADEPTGNLDSENTARLMELVERARSEFGQTIVMVTHNRDLADRADRVCWMNDGRLANGTIA